MSLQKIVDSGNDKFVKWIFEEFDVDTSGLFLHDACKNNYTDTLKILVERVTDIDKLLHGESAFHVAIRLQRTRCSYILFDHVDKNLATSSGESPLHLAVTYHDISLILMLLSDPCVNVNVQNAKGDTTLHYCCRWDNSRALAFLLDHPDVKADVRNNNNMTPYEVARRTNSRECLALLQK